ncbi:MAG: Spy/CpxP family protein refolding chaperone [Candidatus Zixiibacteriota bacterium]
MKKQLFAIAAVALLLPLAAFAQPGSGDGPFCPQGRGMGQGPGQCCMGGGMHRGGPMGDDDHPGIGHLIGLADELGLSEQQRDQLKKMQVEFRMQMIDREAEVEKAEIRLRTLMMDKNAPEAEVGRMIDDVARLRADVQKLKYGHHKQMRGVLTNEQFEKLQKMREERREERRGHGMGHGMGQGMGPCQGQGMGQKACPPGCGKHSMGGRS